MRLAANSRSRFLRRVSAVVAGEVERPPAVGALSVGLLASPPSRPAARRATGAGLAD